MSHSLKFRHGKLATKLPSNWAWNWNTRELFFLLRSLILSTCSNRPHCTQSSQHTFCTTIYAIFSLVLIALSRDSKNNSLLSRVHNFSMINGDGKFKWKIFSCLATWTSQPHPNRLLIHEWIHKSTLPIDSTLWIELQRNFSFFASWNAFGGRWSGDDNDKNRFLCLIKLLLFKSFFWCWVISSSWSLGLLLRRCR